MPSTAVYAPIPYCLEIEKEKHGTGYGIPVTRMALFTYGRMPYTVRCSALLPNKGLRQAEPLRRCIFPLVDFFAYLLFFRPTYLRPLQTHQRSTHYNGTKIPLVNFNAGTAGQVCYLSVHARTKCASLCARYVRVHIFHVQKVC